MWGRRRTAVELALLVGLAGLGLILRHPGVVLLAVPVAVHLCLGLTMALTNRRPQLAARRELSAARALEGEAVSVQVEVENRGPGLELVVVDDHQLSQWVEEGRAQVVDSLSRGGRLTLAYRARPRRGLYALPSVWVEVQDLLGFVLWRGEVDCPAPLAVLPRHERLTGVAVRPRRTLPQPGTVRARRGGAGIEFFGTRDYLPGDDSRRVNWKAVARWGRLMINQYEEERASEVTVVLDVRTHAYPPARRDELFDWAVRGAAGLADCFLRQGHRVGLLLYGRYLDWVPLSSGHHHWQRLLRALARADLGATEVFAELVHLPVRPIPPGSQVALVSPLVPGDEAGVERLRARGYQVLVLVPDPWALEMTALPQSPAVRLGARILELERWSMLARLHTAGARPLVWDVRYPLAPQVKATWRRLR
ncbi:MAG: DUF58 domain-containing protein [Candidatus Bipolaricaulaceae bacterium]